MDIMSNSHSLLAVFIPSDKKMQFNLNVTENH